MFDQIKLEETIQNKNTAKLLKDCDVNQIEPMEDPSHIQPTNELLPLPEQDEHVIAITLKRSTIKDQAMTEFNEIMSGCLLCNTCNTPVGCGQDAKAAVFYNCSYCTKNICKLTECLPLLQIARRNALQYPSVAENAHTDANIAKYTLSKILNQTSKLCEYSLEQCATGLLNMKSLYKTSTTTYIYVRKAMVKLIEDSEDVCYEEGTYDESNQDSDCIHDEESNSDKHDNSLFETNLKMDKFLNTLKRNSSYSINDNNDDGELHKIGQHLYSFSLA